MEYQIKTEDALEITFTELKDENKFDNDLLKIARRMLMQKEVGIYTGEETISILSEILDLALEIRIPRYGVIESLRYGYISNSFYLKEKSTGIRLMSSTTLSNEASMQLGRMIDKVFELNKRDEEQRAYSRLDELLK